MSRSLSAIEGVMTFDDGEQVEFCLSPEGDSAWGNVVAVLGSSVAIRETIARALHEEELWEREDDDDDDN